MDETLKEEQPNNATDQETEEFVEENEVAAEETAKTGQEETVDSPNESQEMDRRITALEAERDELNQRFLRLQADFENFKRRTREEKARDRQFRAMDLITNILPVLDNFERALETTAEHEESKALRQGLEMVYRQLTEALKQEGVSKIVAEGQPFDPNKHQAVMQVESEEHEPNTVVEVLQAGYELNGRVIRPSMVKVSQ
ncbi:MAG: nucleotide exchange factor GrpE [Tuberibacillus sp.]